MRKIFCALLVTATCFTTIISCSKNNSTSNSAGSGSNTLDCTNVPKTFTADVNPIIQRFCNQSACHDAGSSNGVGPLTNFDQVFNARISIRSAIASGVMPQNTTLTTAQKSTIICWIDNGAQNN